MDKRNVCNRRTQTEVVIKEFEKLRLAIQQRINLCIESIAHLEKLGRQDLAAPVRSELLGLTHTLNLIESRTTSIKAGALV